VSDLREAKEDGKVAILLDGDGWMKRHSKQAGSDDPQLLANVERIIARTWA
jgi:hypothetical protein